jgi:hypothetical protein
LDAGELKSRFDVLVFVDGAMRTGLPGAVTPTGIPDEYKAATGRISGAKTIPQLRKFLESGGEVVTIGSSTSVAELLGIPVKNHLAEMGPGMKRTE